MSYSPPTLNALVTYWKSKGGVNLGVVGDTSHVNRGVSYHLGADHLVATAYSRKTARDKAGLTNAASAMDLGRLDGTLTALRSFSVWLVDQARHNQPGTSDMREIIYTADGKTVLRWDRERGYASLPKGGEADNTHLTHTHVSWYRDAEKRDHTTAFRPYFGDRKPIPPPSGGSDVGIPVYLDVTKDSDPYDALGTAKLKVTGVWRVKDNATVQLAAGTDLGVVQRGKRLDNNVAIVALNHAGELHVAPFANVTYTALPKPSTPPPGTDPTPYSKADLDAAHADGVTAGKSTEKDRIATSESNRIKAI